jgi:hypothetical protein
MRSVNRVQKLKKGEINEEELGACAGFVNQKRRKKMPPFA